MLRGYTRGVCMLLQSCAYIFTATFYLLFVLAYSGVCEPMRLWGEFLST
jgi:hypothetical protein